MVGFWLGMESSLFGVFFLFIVGRICFKLKLAFLLFCLVVFGALRILCSVGTYLFGVVRRILLCCDVKFIDWNFRFWVYYLFLLVVGVGGDFRFFRV